jgi:hypothetical protein
MSFAAVLHLVLHALVPAAAAWLLFMLATMVVDLDHLLATPIYDPQRCSIGFHPLHRPPAIAAYAAMTLWPTTRIAGTGLLIHMALDASDCAVQRGLW